LDQEARWNGLLGLFCTNQEQAKEQITWTAAVTFWNDPLLCGITPAANCLAYTDLAGLGSDLNKCHFI